MFASREMWGEASSFRILQLFAIGVVALVALWVVFGYNNEPQAESFATITRACARGLYPHLFNFAPDSEHFLDDLVRQTWQQRLAQGSFRTTLKGMESHSDVLGRHEFWISLVEGRAKKRKTLKTGDDEKHPSIPVYLPFDATKFNFNRADMESELLFTLPSEIAAVEHAKRPVNIVPGRKITLSCQALRSPLHAVTINPFPFAMLSGLVVPYLRQNKPQVATDDGLLIAIRFAGKLKSKYVRVGYNSLGAGASVNHLHFQFWEFEHSLPIEVADTEPMGLLDKTTSMVRVSLDYPIRFFLLTRIQENVEKVSKVMHACVQYLKDSGIPHNMVVSKTGLFLFPRKTMEIFNAVQPGFPEIAGHIITTSRTSYDSLSAQEIDNHWRSKISVSQETFDHIQKECFAF